ncbi:hypothetical protein ACLB2K_015620 [Fragaria x ananassa]
MAEDNHGCGKRRRQDGNVDGLGLTAGIGMKMLKNMGYKGGGLGKNEQGMPNHIQPKLRPKNLGMGFHDYKDTKTDLPNSQEAFVEVGKPPLAKTDVPIWKKNVINKQHMDFCLAEFLAQKIEQEQSVVVDELSGPNLDNEINAVLIRLKEANYMGELTLESLAEEFDDIRRRYTDDWLGSSASPWLGFDIVSAWKGLLHEEECYYTELVREIVLSEVRMTGLNSWQAEEPEPMLAFLESWKELLPGSVVHDILDMVVLPELRVAIQLWEPNLGSVPIHLWVHPWLPLLFELGDEYQLDLEELFGTMRLKLFPKLELVLLEDFEVNPANQKLDQFNWVMRWASAIPMHLMVNVMVKGFFPRCIEGWHLWLKTNPNFEDVVNWYRDWKELIPKEFHANESIRRQLEFGLGMMNQAVEEMEVARPGLEEKSRVAGKRQEKAVPATQTNLEGQTNMDDIDHELNLKEKGKIDQVQFEAKKRAVAFLANAKLDSTTDVDDISHQMTLKDVIEAEAQEHGLLFRPKPGRMYRSAGIWVW